MGSGTGVLGGVGVFGVSGGVIGGVGVIGVGVSLSPPRQQKAKGTTARPKNAQ